MIVQDTVDPWITDDSRAIRKMELCNLRFHTCIFQSDSFDEKNLFSITGAMYVGTQPNMTFYTTVTQIDNRFVKFILVIHAQPGPYPVSRSNKLWLPKDLQYCGYSMI